MSDKLRHIREYTEDATPGVWAWVYHQDLSGRCEVFSEVGDEVAVTYRQPGEMAAKNAEFIANARTDLPLLLTIAEAAECTRLDRDEQRTCPERTDARDDWCAVCDALAALNQEGE